MENRTLIFRQFRQWMPELCKFHYWFVNADGSVRPPLPGYDSDICTGEKDSLGQDIYENDIVLYCGKRYRVEYKDARFCLKDFEQSQLLIWRDMVVCVNIYILLPDDNN